MASSLINNAIQIYFDSVFWMADEGMVQMLKDLEPSGLRGFLGCSSAIYEAALVKAVEISAEVFAGTFELPTEGLTEMTDVPKYLVFDAKSVFSMSGEHLKTSCKKREIKFEFRLLNDILAKIVTVKACSFDVVTHERFLMISATHDGVKVNLGRLLFNIFKDMVTPTSKQTRGFVVHICILLNGAPDLDLGESKEFPPLKILTAKTVGTYIAKNKNISIEEVVDEPVVKKAAPKRRPSPAVVIAETAEIEIGEPDSEETVVLKIAGTEPVETESRTDEMQAQKAALSQELDVFRKEVQDQKAALSNDLMEFRVQEQENFNTLITKLSELVAYINRGGDAKNGEMSISRGPPHPDDQNRPGGGSISEPSRKR
ncbi:hypothetical protein F511_28153 [Dorcoceras hygrometricum]|uniref:Uncharacterized protein n=1 Tax=Dorcoceras hygrometricum TaxID=472368 RepID=A0A2Z7BRK0_9LAMI|nr:hypothetical protein F511_28153 [Dorcoceras hygrometricum]